MLRDLDLTQEEAERLKTSLEKKEFRDLFFDYMNEISDPANRKLYEEELQRLEEERGIAVRYIRPQPEFCLKFSGAAAVFINVCTSNEVGKPTSSIANGGTNWSIPYSLSVGREDTDESGAACTVYDAVFHPETIKRCTNPGFKRIVISTAIEGIEKQFQVKLDAEFKELKMKSKGQPQTTMIREKDPSLVPKQNTSSEYLDDIMKQQTASRGKKSAAVDAKPVVIKYRPPEAPEKAKIITPEYDIVHRDAISDYQRYTTERVKLTGRRPDFIVVRVKLDLLESAAGIDLDVTDVTFHLSVEKKYCLDIKLPFPVNGDEGTAKFDRSKRTLAVTLPVIPAEVEVDEKPLADAICDEDVTEDSEAETECNESKQASGVDEAAKCSAEGTNASSGLSEIKNGPNVLFPEVEQDAGPDDIPDTFLTSENHQTINHEDSMKSSQAAEADVAAITDKLESVSLSTTFKASQDKETLSLIFDFKNAVETSSHVMVESSIVSVNLCNSTETCSFRFDMGVEMKNSYKLDSNGTNTVIVLEKAVPKMLCEFYRISESGREAYQLLSMQNVDEYPSQKEAAVMESASTNVKTKVGVDEFEIKVENKASIQEQRAKPAFKVANAFLFDLD